MNALRLRKQRVDNVSFDIRQAVIAALRSVRQAFVIKAQEVQHRGMQVMHIHRILNDVV